MDYIRFLLSVHINIICYRSCINQRSVGNAFNATFTKALHPVGFVFGIVTWKEGPFGITLTSKNFSNEEVK